LLTVGAQKVSACLWFDKQAGESAKFYKPLVPGSRITSVSCYGKGMPVVMASAKPDIARLEAAFNIA
jgi:predicted 3-demethylubiquinone-9 3-methyltransferase (glyoxalase superfamily)